jgi:hypothetical protein
MRADDTVGSYINQKLPPIDECPLDDRDCWLLGRWLADGHVGVRGDYWVSIGKEKIDRFEDIAGDAAGTRSEMTAIQIRLKGLSGGLLSLLSECGRGAHEKQVPIQALCFPKEKAAKVLDGYLSGDGHYLADRQRWVASSVSRKLLLGISMLAQRVHGAIASVYAGRVPGETVIQGRTVNTRQDWILCFDIPYDGRREKPFIADDGAWKKVRSADAFRDVETWCLKVDEDESFTAEGCIVKNCPLQLDLIERAVVLWSNPGEVVFSPFTGIGSEGVVSVKKKRKFIGTELKDGYFRIAADNLAHAENESATPSLVDLMEGAA